MAKAGPIPDVTVWTHDGRQARFYTDLVKGKIVLINVMFVGCADVCPLVTANLREVQERLQPHVGRDVFMYSISLQPELETPAILADYAREHDVGPGWLFLTGDPDELSTLRQGIGLSSRSREADLYDDDHTGLLRYGNDRLDRWSGCPALGRAEWIAETIKITAAIG